MTQPISLKLTLIFEDADENQESEIDVRGAKSIGIESVPEFREDLLKDNKEITKTVIRNTYLITVNYE